MNLGRLNPEQRVAVTHGEGPLLVLAGAGSGKTSVITSRIGWLIEQGVRSDSILGVTFTNKAAAEMRERVTAAVPFADAKRVTLGTFHSLGARILRAEIARLGYDKRFTILDESEKKRILRDILKEARLPSTGGAEGRVLNIISKAKNAMSSPAQLPEARFNPEMPRAQRVFEKYQAALVALSAVDFDDLLLLPVRLFREFPDVRARFRHAYRYFLVDEFQDTNPIQLAMLQELVGSPYNITAVGDDDQSIYAFRGAVADNILNFGDFFPDPKMVALEQNYRSVTSILDAANGVIANNATRHEKKLWSRLGKGSPVIAAAHASDISEADYIVRRIKKQAEMQQRPLDNFAVLYRSNSQTRVLEEALKQHAVPYRLLGGSSVFDRREVKDVVAYLRLVLNPRDEMAIRRVINVPTRGVGATSLSTLDQRAKAAGQRLTETVRAAMTDGTLQNRAVEGLERFYVALDAARERIRGAQPSELPAITKQLLVDIGMETYVRTTEKNPRVADVRWRIVEELLDRLGQAEGSSAFSALDDYISVLALDTSAQNETAADHVGKVVLSTLHSSKGLEFPVVYMCGMSEGTLPHENAIKEGSAGVSEERRLCYVGMTRAKESLVLTRPRYVLLRGQKIPREPSRFLDEIPPHLLHELDQQQNAAALAAKAERNLEHLAKLKAMLDD